MARAQLDKLRELVAAGKSDDQIRAYFVDRYGEWVLLSPRAEGFNWLVWLGPAALLVGGFAVIIYQIRKRSSKDRPQQTELPADDYLRQVRSELER
jgi:cytochrome c-type biogenesis protein CcmH